MVLMMSAGAAVWGQTPAATPVPVGRASVASISVLNGLMGDLGLPPQPLAQLIESRLPLPLEKGSVAEDQPLGVVFVAGDKLPSNPLAAMVVVLPVVKGKLSEADLKKNAGAEAVKNQPGVMATTTAALRRTEKYLLGQMGKPAGIAVVAADPFAADYKDKSNVAVISMDVVALRKLLGPTLQQMAAQAQPTIVPATGNAPTMAYAGMANVAAGPAMSFFNNVDKLTVAVAQDDKNVHLRTWVSPFAGASGAALPSMPQPKFPNGTVVVTHVIYPNAQAAQWTQTVPDALPDMQGTKEDNHKFHGFQKRFLKLIAGGDAVSIGVAPRGNEEIFYLVSQQHDAVDYPAEIDALNTMFKATHGAHPDESAEVSSYDAGGKKVVRLTDKHASGAIEIVVDGIQDGKNIYMTFAPNEGHYVADLASAGMGPTSNMTMAGALDLGALAQSLAAGAPRGGTQGEMFSGLGTSLAGQSVTWSAQVMPAQKTLLLQLHAPKAALKVLAGLAMHSAGPAGAPPAAPMPGGGAQ